MIDTSGTMFFGLNLKKKKYYQIYQIYLLYTPKTYTTYKYIQIYTYKKVVYIKILLSENDAIEAVQFHHSL